MLTHSTRGWGNLEPSPSCAQSETDGGWTIELELALEDEAGDDDPTLPLWLVPAWERFQRLTLRASAFEQDPVDASEVPADGRLVEEFSVIEAHGVISVELALHDRDLLATGPGEVVVHEAEKRTASLSTDPDVVRMTFRGAPAWSDLSAPLPEGAEQHVVDERAGDSRTFELRRGVGSATAFVQLLHQLAQGATFLRASSGDETFDREAWLNYVTPGLRPW